MKICFKNTAKPYQNQKKVKYEQVYCLSIISSNNLRRVSAIHLVYEVTILPENL